MELWFYRGLQNIAVWVGAVVFLIPSLFLSVFLMGEAFQWFDKAHWIRITLCTLGNAARETRTHGNVFVLHELDRCDVDTGAKGLDLILNYYATNSHCLSRCPSIRFSA